MRLDCGQSWKVRRELRRERKGIRWDEKVKRLSKWHLVFAWRPIRVGQFDCRWLEDVQRKGIYDPHYGYWLWVYKPLWNKY